jgi:hypothetical protein
MLALDYDGDRRVSVAWTVMLIWSVFNIAFVTQLHRKEDHVDHRQTVQRESDSHLALSDFPNKVGEDFDKKLPINIEAESK